MKQKTIIYTLLIVLLITSAYAAPIQYEYITSAKQYYSVFFDEEDEAYIALRLDMNNKEDKPIDYLNVEIPGYNVQILNVLERSGYTYNKIDVQSSRLSRSTVLTLKINSIEPGKDTSIMIIYKVEGYSNEVLGNHDFTFETVKLPYTTSDVRVSINVQEGLILKGGKANVNYLPSFTKFSGQITTELNKEVSAYSDRLLYEPRFVKTASMLDPLESFTVKGTFSRSWLLLYLVNVLGFAVLAAIGIFLVALFWRKIRNNTPAIAGLYSAISISFICTLTYFISRIIHNTLYGSGQLIIILLLLLCSLIVFCILVGVPIYVGIKEGALQGLLSGLYTLLWLFTLSIIIVILFIRANS